MAASAIPSSITPSTSLYRQLTNARGAIAAGEGQRYADDVMRETLTRWLADNAVGSLDGLPTEYALVCLAVDEGFARRGLRARAEPMPPLPQVPPQAQTDWRVFGLDARAVAILALAVMLLLGGNW